MRGERLGPKLRGVGAALLAGLLALSLSGCDKKESTAAEPPPSSTSAAATKEPKLTPSPSETEKTPAEPYILTEVLNGLTAENSPHYAQVINAHDAAAKGMNQYVIQDPNTTDVRLFTIDLPNNIKIQSVKKYEHVTDGDWGQTNATGTVIDLGQNDIEKDEIDANNPQVEVYVFNKPDMSPKEFAASIKTSPWFLNHSYDNTNANEFKEFWAESTDGLFVNLAWGDMGGVYSHEANIGKMTSGPNENSQIDPAQFSSNYKKEYKDDYWFGGQAFCRSTVDDNITQFITYTFIRGTIGANGAEGKIPNFNNSAVRELLISYNSDMELGPVSAKVNGKYAILD